MRNIQTKQDNVGDTLAAAEFNSISNELKNVVTTTGQSLDAASGPDTSLNMLGKAMRAYGSAGQFFICGGTANAITLIKSANFQEMPSLIDGIIIRWKATLTNTGSVTITLSGLTTKTLTTASGDALSGGELIANRYSSAVYNSSNNRFELINNLSSFVGSTYDNVSTGRYAGYQINGAGGGQYNTCTGSETGKALTTGNSNTLTGRRAGYKITTGIANTITGRDAGSSLVSAQYNVLMGLSCGLDWVAAQSNTAVGTSIGVGVATGSASYNALFGMRCGYALDTGSYNTLSGYYCCSSLSSGSYNNVSGQYAGEKMTSASYNVINGSSAASSLTTGNGNVYIGADAADSATIGSGNVCIGKGSGADIITASNQLRIGTNVGALISGDFSTGAMSIAGALTTGGDLTIGGNTNISGTVIGIPVKIQARYVVSSGTYGYLMTVGSYQEIPLNMVMYNNLTGASLSSNRITLPVGTYSINAKIPMANSIGGGWTEVNLRSRLYNVTDSAALIYGLNTKTGGNEAEGYGALLVMDGVFVVTGSSKTFSIQVRSNYSVYLGMPCSFGDNEQYSDIEIIKLA